jgi:hypothetical protein
MSTTAAARCGPPPKPPTAETFTLRVWRDGAQFRAVLRAVGEEQLHLFDEPARVGEFLARLGQPLPSTESEKS